MTRAQALGSPRESWTTMLGDGLGDDASGGGEFSLVLYTPATPKDSNYQTRSSKMRLNTGLKSDSNNCWKRLQVVFPRSKIAFESVFGPDSKRTQTGFNMDSNQVQNGL